MNDNINYNTYFTKLEYENNSSYNYTICHINQSLSISAEVILKSMSGKSLTNSNTSITSENIKEFEPSKENIKIAIKALEKLGFEVFHNGLTITIVGDKSLYEQIFKSKLCIDVYKQNGMAVYTLKQLSIPNLLLNIVEDIIFIPPPIYFDKNYIN